VPFRWTQSRLTLCRSTISLEIANYCTRGRSPYNTALLTCVADASRLKRNQIFAHNDIIELREGERERERERESSYPSNNFIIAVEFLSLKNIRARQLPRFTLLAIRERNLDRDRSMHSCRRLDLRLRSCTHVCFRLLTHRRGRRPSVYTGR